MLVSQRKEWAAWYVRSQGEGRLRDAYRGAVEAGRKPVREGNTKGNKIWSAWMEANSNWGTETWDVVRIVGPHRTTSVVAVNPRRERMAAHHIRSEGRRAEAASSVEVLAVPNRTVKRRATHEDSVRRMRPRWSGHMRGTMGRPRVGPLVVPTSGEEWIGPTEDDEEMERKAVEGWVWEGEAKGDG